jgi:hypothetical protein
MILTRGLVRTDTMVVLGVSYGASGRGRNATPCILLIVMLLKRNKYVHRALPPMDKLALPDQRRVVDKAHGMVPVGQIRASVVALLQEPAWSRAGEAGLTLVNVDPMS